MNLNRNLLFLALAAGGLAKLPASEPDKFAVFDYLPKYNVTWDSQSENSAGSMPLGGGQIGANVWAENGDLLLYAQQSGAFDKNGEYLKMGRFRIRLDPNPFAPGATFRQEFKVREGAIQIAGDTPAHGKVVINLWVEVKRPVIHVDVQAEQPVAVSAAYESWRFKDVLIPQDRNPTQGRRSSIFDYDNYLVDLTKKADVIEPGGDRVMWYQDNAKEFNAFQFAIKNEGLDAIRGRMWDPLENLISGGLMKCPGLEFAGVSDGTYFKTPFKAWTFKSTRAAQEFHLEIFGRIEKSPTAAAWKTKLNALANAPADHEKIRSETLAWWQAFWQRSYIVIDPARDAADPAWRVGRNYQLFRYELGGNTYGKAPTKFNGGNLTYDPGYVAPAYPFDPDFRRWGGWSYTSANQRLVYWPLLKDGDFDAMIPEFDVYRNALGNSEARTRAHFGHEGCSFAEQYQNSGMPVVSHYGFFEHGYSWSIRPKDTVDGELPNPWIATLYHGQLEHAFMILEYYRFSGRDVSPYLPFIVSSVKFYDQHYQMIHRQKTGQPLDEHGKLVIFPSTPSEHHLNSTNPADAVAGLIAVTKSVLALPPALLTPKVRAYFTGFQKRMPDLPTVAREIDGKPRTLLKSSQNEEGWGEGFFANMHAAFPYNLLYTGSPNFDWARDTWTYNVSAHEKQQYVGHRPSVIYSARMGLVDEAKFTVTGKLDDNKGNGARFPSFWGPGFDWGPDHNWPGGGSIGLQEMLLQTPGKEIRLLPAWPKDWDVAFKLHAPYDTTVEVEYKGGKVTRLEVTPKSRRADVIDPPANGSLR